MTFIEQSETMIRKQLKISQLLLFVSILLAGAVLLFSQDNYFWALYFVLIGAMSLPNINKCKKDLINIKENALLIVEGKVMDIFPEKDGSDKWIVFIEEAETKKMHEFLLPGTVNELKEGTDVQLYYSEKLKLPITIQQKNNPS